MSDTAVWFDLVESALENCERDVKLRVSTGGIANEVPALCGLLIRRDAESAFVRVHVPLDDATAESVRAVGRASAFGKGTATLHDASVRSCVELQPDQFAFEHPKWSAAIDALAARAFDALQGGGTSGAANKNIVCSPYKLLLYSTGDHFVAHRDTEKVPGMFATLVLQLPSRCSGGALLVRFKRGKESAAKETVHDFGHNSGMAPFACHFAMHFADVEHELLPVESGHRLAVVFNVAWTDQTGAALLSAANAGLAHQPLLMALLAWPRSVPLVALPLEHQYTEASLQGRGVGALKGKDRAVAQFVQSALRHLPSGKRVELFCLEMRRRKTENGNGWEYDTLEWETEEEGDSVALCFDSQGRLVDFVEDVLEGDEELAVVDHLLPRDTDASDFWGDAIDEEEDGYLGNEGMSRTTTYGRFVLVLVPMSDSFDDLLFQRGLAPALRKLNDAPPADRVGMLEMLADWCATVQLDVKQLVHSDVVELLSLLGVNAERAGVLLRFIDGHVSTPNRDLVDAVFSLATRFELHAALPALVRRWREPAVPAVLAALAPYAATQVDFVVSVIEALAERSLEALQGGSVVLGQLVDRASGGAGAARIVEAICCRFLPAVCDWSERMECVVRLCGAAFAHGGVGSLVALLRILSLPPGPPQWRRFSVDVSTVFRSALKASSNDAAVIDALCDFVAPHTTDVAVCVEALAAVGPPALARARPLFAALVSIDASTFRHAAALGDAALIGELADRFLRRTPTAAVLSTTISTLLGSGNASELAQLAAQRLCDARLAQLDARLAGGCPAFSWTVDNCTGVHPEWPAELRAFLQSADIELQRLAVPAGKHAAKRIAASLHGFPVTTEVGGAAAKSFVVVKKTRACHTARLAAYRAVENEKRNLQAQMERASASKKRTHEEFRGHDEKFNEKK
jgi:hypothetical protein